MAIAVFTVVCITVAIAGYALTILSLMARIGMLEKASKAQLNTIRELQVKVDMLENGVSHAT